MKCDKCGSKLKSNENFCSKCGTKIKFSKDNEVRKSVPKWIYYIFLVVYLISLGILISFLILNVSMENQYWLMLSLFQFIILPLAAYSLVVGTFLLAKKYYWVHLVLPIYTIVTAVVVFIQFLKFTVFFIYSTIGVLLSLYYIWKK